MPCKPFQPGLMFVGKARSLPDLRNRNALDLNRVQSYLSTLTNLEIDSKKIDCYDKLIRRSWPSYHLGYYHPNNNPIKF